MSAPAWPGVEYKGYAFTEDDLNQVIEQLGDNILNVKKQYWKDKLLNVQDYINKALDAVFSDENAWKQIMGGRAAPRYAQFVNPNYARAGMILLKHRVKLLASYNKWKTNKDAAFQAGGAFEQGVQAADDYYAQGVKIVYRMTGVRPLGLGPAVKAFLIISGIQPPLDSRRDTLTGQVRNLLFSDTLYFVGYAAIPAIVEATVYANYAHMAGETQERDNILNEISNEVKELLTRLAADDVQIDAFKVGYDSNVNNYYVYLKASPKTA